MREQTVNPKPHILNGINVGRLEATESSGCEIALVPNILDRQSTRGLEQQNSTVLASQDSTGRPQWKASFGVAESLTHQRSSSGLGGAPKPASAALQGATAKRERRKASLEAEICRDSILQEAGLDRCRGLKQALLYPEMLHQSTHRWAVQ